MNGKINKSPLGKLENIFKKFVNKVNKKLNKDILE